MCGIFQDGGPAQPRERKEAMRVLLVVLCWVMTAFLVWAALQRSAERGIVTGLLALAAGAAFVASIVILRWNRPG